MNLYYNFNSIGALVATIFVTLGAVFFLTLRERTRSTTVLGLVFLFLIPLNAAYLLTTVVLEPWAASYRWFTIPGALLSFTFMSQFALRFPENTHPRFSRVVLAAQLILTLVCCALFFVKSLDAPRVLSMASHNYEFAFAPLRIDIENRFLWALAVLFAGSLIEFGASRFAINLAMWFLVLFVLLSVWKVSRTREHRERVSLLIISGGLLAAMIIPTATNLMSLMGALDRGIHTLTFVFSSVIGYFIVFINYFNTTRDRTTFMMKIAGISLVSILLLAQILSFIALRGGDDAFRREGRQITRAVARLHDGGAGDKLKLYAARTDNLNFIIDGEGPAARLLYDREGNSEHLRRFMREPGKVFPGTKSIFGPRPVRVGPTPYMTFGIREAGKTLVVGVPYRAYRRRISSVAAGITYSTIAMVMVVLLLFPLFFRFTLINPLNLLLEGVRKVNKGLLKVRVPVLVEDEIGFLARSFNGMVETIRDATERLEDKVRERTSALREKIEEIQKLKTQQDGDYYLTSLLATPLFYNANKSELIATDFLLRQKKQFEFRGKHAELGGDICVTGNLRLGDETNPRRYTVALNGDAMGKSMQGAGGALVMGVMMNSIMARSARGNRVLRTTPEEWLAEVYEELSGGFLAFNGAMSMSATLAVIDDISGELFYFNAEHPWMVLYRRGKASFVEGGFHLRKLGVHSDVAFDVRCFQLEPGDIVLMGSDGRDDLNLAPGAATKDVNMDETLFLRKVEAGRGDPRLIYDALMETGEATDDISLLRVRFQEQGAPLIAPAKSMPDQSRFKEFYNSGKKLFRSGHYRPALEELEKAYNLRSDVPALNKLLARVTFRLKEYGRAVEVLRAYLHSEPNAPQFWFYLSIALKRTGEYDLAIDAANKARSLNGEIAGNLVNLADLYHRTGEKKRALEFVNLALMNDPSNNEALKLRTSLGD